MNTPNEPQSPSTLKKLLATALCALSAAVFTGCIAAAAAGGGAAVYYALSDVEYTAPAPMDKVWSATLAGMQDMELLPEAKSHGDTKSSVEAIAPGDKQVRITLKADSPEVTSIYVRVGIKGDKVYSQQLMDKIKARLN